MLLVGIAPMTQGLSAWRILASQSPRGGLKIWLIIESQSHLYKHAG